MLPGAADASARRTTTTVAAARPKGGLERAFAQQFAYQSDVGGFHPGKGQREGRGAGEGELSPW